jgi:hypothetical protein
MKRCGRGGRSSTMPQIAAVVAEGEHRPDGGRERERTADGDRPPWRRKPPALGGDLACRVRGPTDAHPVTRRVAQIARGLRQRAADARNRAAVLRQDRDQEAICIGRRRLLVEQTFELDVGIAKRTVRVKGREAPRTRGLEPLARCNLSRATALASHREPPSQHLCGRHTVGYSSAETRSSRRSEHLQMHRSLVPIPMSGDRQDWSTSRRAC